MWRIDSLERTLMLGGIGGQEEKGTTEDEMAGWHHWLDEHESEWTSGDGDGQGGLVCCNSWGRKKSDMTEWLNWTELKDNLVQFSHYLSCMYTDCTISIQALLKRIASQWFWANDSEQCGRHSNWTKNWEQYKKRMFCLEKNKVKENWSLISPLYLHVLYIKLFLSI